MERRADGRVVYHLRRPWPNPTGANQLVLDPAELLRRLAALVPAPYTNLVRYHGVFAPRSRHRTRLPKPPSPKIHEVAKTPSRTAPDSQNTLDPVPVQPTPQTPLRDARTRRRRTLPWAQLLRRVFFIDALTCPRCDASMVVLALLSEPAVVRKILLHLGLPADVPSPAPAVFQDDEPFLDDPIHTTTPARPPP